MTSLESRNFGEALLSARLRATRKLRTWCSTSDTLGLNRREGVQGLAGAITAWVATWVKARAQVPMLSAFEGLRSPAAVQGTIQPGYSATLLFLRSASLPMSDRQQLEVPRCSQSPP